MVDFLEYSLGAPLIWFKFLLVCCFSNCFQGNVIFKICGIPQTTQYMICGFLCGPYISQVLTHEDLFDLYYVNHVAISFIAFSIGAELTESELSTYLRTMLYMWVVGMCTSVRLSQLFDQYRE